MTDADDTPAGPAAPPYEPIACSRYSEYEVAILHRSKLRLRWAQQNVVYEQIVLPLDLKTERHEEFLICRDEQGVLHTIRLDLIHKTEPA